MTKPNYTHIHVLFDRSGSMAGRESDVNGWYKTFFAEQRKLPGELTVSVAQFDDISYDTVIEWSDVRNIPEEFKLDPRANTPLRDSLAKSIRTLGDRLAAMKEEDRPSKVLIVIHTDGHENASGEWSQKQVKEMVERQKKDYAWEFLFLGAGIDAFDDAAAFGIGATTTLSSGHNSQGYMKSALVNTAAVGRWRGGQTLAYTQQEQDEAEKTKGS